MFRIPDNLTRKDAVEYLVHHGLIPIVEAASQSVPGVNEKLETTVPYQPDLVDLCRLHRLVTENKRTTVLELGTGWSTWIFADALSKVKSSADTKVNLLRRNNLFELHVVDDQPEYIKIASSRMPHDLRKLATFHHKSVSMGTFNDRICTYYESLPLCSPDFIYIDSPNQFSAKSDISGWSTRHKDMLPMSADILRIEHFLLPGTIIVFDGRAANARFFRSNIQRNWSYHFHDDYDQHIFVLDEPPLGPYNKLQLEYYSS